MIQCRVLSCTVSAPILVMTMLYDQKYSKFSVERSGQKFGSTVTSIWRVTARYVRLSEDFCSMGSTIPMEPALDRAALDRPALDQLQIPTVVSTKFRPKAHPPGRVLGFYLANPVPKMPSDTIFGSGGMSKVHLETVPDDVDCGSNCRTSA